MYKLTLSMKLEQDRHIRYEVDQVAEHKLAKALKHAHARLKEIKQETGSAGMQPATATE